MSLEIISIKMFVLGLLVLAAHFGGVISHRLRIGEVTGQILGGVVVGPHFLEVLRRAAVSIGLDEVPGIGRGVQFLTDHLGTYAAMFDGLRFFVFLFLGVIAFSIGEELHRDRMKAIGVRGVSVCLIQALATWALLSFGFLLLGFRPIYALVIGSIGIATAPAVTFVLMNRLRIEGRLRTLLANIVVLDDFIEVVVFSVTLGVGMAIEKHGQIDILSVGRHAVVEFVLAVACGALLFLVLKMLIPKKIRRTEPDGEEAHDFLAQIVYEHPTPSLEIMLIIFGILSVGLSLVIHLHLPFLIVAVTAGFMVSNFHSHALFDSLKLENVTPLLNLLFFGIVGATIELECFSRQSLLFILAYLALRGGGKTLGTWLGCRITGQDPKITACMPTLMLPQAGIAAVETLLVAQALNEGSLIFQIVIPAIVIFELGGAFLSERTLLKWKSWVVGERAAMKATSADVTPGDYSLSNLVGDRILREFEAPNKTEAIHALASYLEKQGIVSEAESVAQSCLEREKLSTTAVGDGIAMPHCRKSEVDHVVVACAILKERRGIEWGAPDGRPVRLIFLLVSPDAKPEQNLHALHGIATALAKRDFDQKLQEAARQGKVEELFRELSSKVVDEAEM